MSRDIGLIASVKARLQNKARESNRPFNDLLQLYGIERFLYRLSCSPYANQFVLKGALMLLTLDIPSFRPTRDIDLLGYTNNNLKNVLRIVREICSLDVEPDGITLTWSNAVSIPSKRMLITKAYACCCRLIWEKHGYHCKLILVLQMSSRPRRSKYGTPHCFHSTRRYSEDIRWKRLWLKNYKRWYFSEASTAG